MKIVNSVFRELVISNDKVTSEQLRMKCGF